jgi:hypothetical protein
MPGLEKDPWGRSYVYEMESVDLDGDGTDDREYFKIMSLGTDGLTGEDGVDLNDDGKDDNEDDISMGYIPE